MLIQNAVINEFCLELALLNYNSFMKSSNNLFII